jgi:hypothetical protein
MKIGRFISKLLETDKKLINNPSKLNYDIEEFINNYKAIIIGQNFEFEIVSGKDIKKYYNRISYYALKGNLGMSCMAHRSCQGYFDIYVNNPEVCKMLILKSKQIPDKIFGRALLWKLNNGKTMMDFVYKIDEYHNYIFEIEAKRRGFILRNEAVRNGNKVSVKLRNHKHRNMSNGILSFFFSIFYPGTRYPFLDTLQYLNVKTNILTNQLPDFPSYEWINLRSTSGEYRNCY